MFGWIEEVRNREQWEEEKNCTVIIKKKNPAIKGENSKSDI